MINLKLTVISAVLGLFLSLLIGMVSHVTLGFMILRAFISAVLTGGIAAAASFVFKKFLTDDAENVTAAQNTPATGNVVDITLKVDEDVLPDTDNAPQFYVSPESLRVQKPVDVYRTAAKKSTTESAAPEPVKESEPEPDNAGSFVPKPLVSEKTPQFNIVTGAEAPQEAESSSAKKTEYQEITVSSEGIEGLDELPDLSDVVADADNEVTDVISDSDFATAQNTSASYSAGSGRAEVDVGNDATLMADTIRTLLKSEG